MWKLSLFCVIYQNIKIFYSVIPKVVALLWLREAVSSTLEADSKEGCIVLLIPFEKLPSSPLPPLPPGKTCDLHLSLYGICNIASFVQHINSVPEQWQFTGLAGGIWLPRRARKLRIFACPAACKDATMQALWGSGDFSPSAEIKSWNCYKGIPRESEKWCLQLVVLGGKLENGDKHMS